MGREKGGWAGNRRVGRGIGGWVGNRRVGRE